MAKYREKPVVIYAQQFKPHEDHILWPSGVIPWSDTDFHRPRDMSWGYVRTLEGRMHVQADDWIITGIHGEKYPCKPDIFLATYEAVEEEGAPARREGEE